MYLQVAGLTGVSIGVIQLTTGGGSIGVSSMEKLIISGSFVFGIAVIVVGMLLVMSGFLGITLFSIRLQNGHFAAKGLDMIYHSGLFLIAILCLVSMGLTVWIWLRASKGDVYDEMLWKDLVRTHPLYLCATEQRLECAAYKLQQCNEVANRTNVLFCPGHFCIDFCRIATEEVNVQPVCESCRKDPLKNIDTLSECRRYESEYTAVNGCKEVVQVDVLASYRRLVAVSLVTFVWVMVSVLVSTYQYCFS